MVLTLNISEMIIQSTVLFCISKSYLMTASNRTLSVWYCFRMGMMSFCKMQASPNCLLMSQVSSSLFKKRIRSLTVSVKEKLPVMKNKRICCFFYISKLLNRSGNGILIFVVAVNLEYQVSVLLNCTVYLKLNIIPKQSGSFTYFLPSWYPRALHVACSSTSITMIGYCNAISV